MEKLYFQRRKYGKELLLDAVHTDEMSIMDDKLVLSFYGIGILKAAGGQYAIDTQDFNLQAYMTLFIRPGQINVLTNAEFKEGYFLFFEGDFLDEFFSDKNFIYRFSYFHNPKSPDYLLLSQALFPRLYSVAEEIHHEIKNLNTDSKHILRSLIYYLLVRLHRAYSEAYGHHERTLPDENLLQFLRLLEKAAPQGNLQVQEFADTLGLSRTTLNKLCQTYFSKPVNQVIREHVISEIKKSIRFSGKNLAEIAYDFGFSAPAHFSRFFRQMTGESPRQFRANLRP